MIFTAVWGWTLERMAYRPLRESFRLAPLITAIGMSIALQNFVQTVQGARVKPLQSLIKGGYTIAEKDGFSVSLSNMQILIVYPPVIRLCSGLTRAPCTVCTKFCNAIDMPIAVISGASRNDSLSGR